MRIQWEINIPHLNKSSFELRASRNLFIGFLHKLLRTSVGAKEGNLLRIKAVHTSAGISRKSLARREVEYEEERSFVGLADRFCLASYYLFFPLFRRRRRRLLLFPLETRPALSSSPSLKELAESASLARNSRLCITKRNAVKQNATDKRTEACISIY